MTPSPMTPDPVKHSVADGARPPETVDRLMVGICGAIWLVWLVVAVIATVACVNLGRGRGSASQGASWLLYTIIAVSAVTIIAAIPLLLRARRDALADGGTAAEPASPRHAAPAVPARAAEAPTEKIRVFGTAVDPAELQTKTQARQGVSPLAAEIDRQWLRGTTAILGATGLGWISVAIATYLLAVGSDNAAIGALVAAAVATGAIAAAFVVFSRRLSEAAAARS